MKKPVVVIGGGFGCKSNETGRTKQPTERSDEKHSDQLPSRIRNILRKKNAKIIEGSGFKII